MLVGKLLITFLFFIILAKIAVRDFYAQEIPNRFVLVLGLIGIAAVPLFPEISWLERGSGVFCVSLPLFLSSVFVPGIFGGGDVKLAAAGGWILGWKYHLIAFVLAVLLASPYAVLLLIKKADRKQKFAFGPFLCIGMAAAFLWGAQMWEWYWT